MALKGGTKTRGGVGLRPGALPFLLGLLFSAGLCMGEPSHPETSSTTDRDDSSPVRRFVCLDEDPELNDLLNKARFFEEQDNWPKAFDLYHKVLQRAKATTLVRLDERTYGNLRAYLRRRLASLPAERLHQYRLLYDHHARRLLKEALNPLSVEKLEQVAAKYFISSVGDDALDVLGEVHRERGRWRRAIECWRQILEVYPDTDLPRRILWVKVLECYLALGEKQGARAALAKLEQLVGPTGALTLGGKRRSLAEFAERVARLKKPPRKGEVGPGGGSWPQVGGSPAHVAPPPEGGPADVRIWRFHLPQTGSKPNPRRRSHYLTFLPGIPSICPVAAEERVFVNGRRAVYAVNASSGRLVWSYRIGVRHAFPGISLSVGSVRQSTCAVGRGKVFAVLYPDAPILVALEAKTGRPLWSTPLPPKEVEIKGRVFAVSEPLFKREAVFLHLATVVTAGSTAVAGIHLDHHVLAVEAATGKVRWSRFLCTTAAAWLTPFGRRMLSYPVLEVPAADEERVYVSTEAGVVAALDLRTGEVVWATLYEQNPNYRPPRWTALRLVRNRPVVRADLLPDGWRTSVPMVLGDRVVFTPSDAAHLLCLEAATGRLLWQRPWKGGRYALATPNGRILVVGEDVQAIDSTTGQVLWHRSAPRLQPRGLPFLVKGTLFVPDRERLYRFALADGKLLGTFRFDPRDPNSESGNLLWTGSTLVSATNRALNGFSDRSLVVARLNDRIKANPRDAEAYFQLGEIFSRSEEYSQAIRQYEKALAVCPPSLRYQSLSLREVLRNRLYEHHYAAARTSKEKSSALAHALACLDYAPDPARRLKAKLLAVSLYRKLARWEDLADLWQSILLEEPDEEYPLPDGSSTTAAVVAREALAELIATHGRKIYTRHDAAAERLLKSGDRRSLERLVEAYPNSLAWSRGLIALGDVLAAEGNFCRAVACYQRYLRTDASGDKDQRTRVYVRLIEAQSRAGWVASARRSLARLLAENPNGRVRFRDREMTVKDYATLLRSRREFARTSASSPRLPDLDLPLSRAWRVPIPRARLIKVKLQLIGTGPAGRNVYFLTDPSTSLGCLDPVSGRPCWLRRIPNLPRIYHYLVGEQSILVADNLRVAAIDPATGKVRWVVRLPDPQKEHASARAGRRAGEQLIVRGAGAQLLLVARAAPPRAYLGVVGLALSEQGALVVRRCFSPTRPRLSTEVTLLDPDTGQVLWRRGFAGQPAQLPLLAEDTVIICTQNPNQVLALDLDNGRPRHHWRLADNERFSGPPVVSSGALAFVAGAGNTNRVTLVDLQGGKVLWQRRITVNRSSHRPTYLMPTYLVVREGKLLYIPRRNFCAALDLRDGHILWKRSFPGTPNAYQSHLLVSPKAIFAVHHFSRGGKILARVSRIEAATGRVAWSIQMPETGQVCDIALSAEHLVVALAPQRAAFRRVGKRRIATRTGLPPKVFLLNQTNGGVEEVLKTGRENPNPALAYQPAWVVVREGRVILSDFRKEMVGFGPTRTRRTGSR